VLGSYEGLGNGEEEEIELILKLRRPGNKVRLDNVGPIEK
jgi:hypothetical protein